MNLRDGGIDLFYIDESERFPLSLVTAVRVPLLRQVEGVWTFVWQDYLDKAIAWRKSLSDAHNIRSRVELHGYEILAHKGLLLKTHQNLRPDEAVKLYSNALQTIDFLPSNSVITVFATDKSELMGHKGIKAAMFGLFQRIRRQCGDAVNGLLLFDDGHPEYISYFRQATRFMPTGSRHGGWNGKATANLPLDMFPKDANLKASRLSLFLQIADLIVYSARLKLEAERGTLAEKRVKRGHATLYDTLNADVVNQAATNKRRDRIVPV
ncbi:MAG: hypothetical protein JSS36_11565 [Proteobacteria bacterium]|nr:hypothetical protein [Pseudomonadota bacterium]